MNIHWPSEWGKLPVETVNGKSVVAFLLTNFNYFNYLSDVQTDILPTIQHVEIRRKFIVSPCLSFICSLPSKDLILLLINC